MLLLGAVYLHAVLALDPAADVYVPPLGDTPLNELQLLQLVAVPPP